MSEINVLSADISNKIAAGEVVERTFNVVKELVENSADAGADFIKVEILDGGMSLIKVTDNGRGILKEDLPKTVLRFATSKINSIEDVYRIKTFGFRGEALAAISSVSEMTIDSRRAGEEGYGVSIFCGEISEVYPSSIPEGTILAVKNIFRNIPVRKKFVKSESAETNEIIKFLKVFSIINPGIDIKVISNEKEIFHVTKNDDSLSRFKKLFDIQKVFFIDEKSEHINIKGVFTLPVYQRGRKDMIFTGINGRVVKDFGIIQAVVQGYFRILPQDKFPAGVVFIEISPENVDVNIHPTKQQVKILEDKSVFSSISKAISSGLRKQTLGRDNGGVEQNSSDDNIFGQFNSSYVKDSALGYAFDISQVLETKSTSEAYDTNFKIIGQAFNSIVIVEIENELYFIDQHIAHERVLYEKYRKNAQKEIVSVRLVEPIAIEMEERDKEILLKNSDILSNLGFDVDDFGNNLLSVSRVPGGVIHKNIKSEIFSILEDFYKNKSENFLDSASLTMSCKNAIKAGDVLTDFEMRKVVKDLLDSENPYTCPHGRPIIFKMTKEELFKKYNRK